MTCQVDHGILFKPDLILATLAGRKFMTRRAVTQHNSLIDGSGYGIKAHWPKLQWDRAWVDGGPSPAGNPGDYWKVPCSCMGTGPKSEVIHRVYPRVQPGDRLWIREAWAVGGHHESFKPRDILRSARVYYRHAGAELPAGSAWRSPLHLPKWAARVWMDVIRVGAERAQDITESDCIAEGAPIARVQDAREWGPIKDGFANLWDKINGHRPGLSWADSPPVWVYEWPPLQG